MVANKIARVSGKRPYVAIICVLLLTGFAGYGIMKIRTTYDQREFVPEDYTSAKATEEFENEIGLVAGEYILLEADDVTKADSFRAIVDLENLLDEREEFQNYIKSIESYVDYVPPPRNFELMPDNALETYIQNLLTQLKIRRMTEGLISENRNAALIKIRIASGLSESALMEKTDSLETFVSGFSDNREDLTAKTTGYYSMQKEMSEESKRDNSILIPAVIAFVIAVLFLIFRRPSDVAMPLLILVVEIIWVMGLMGYLGIKFTSIHVALIPILLGLSVDYVIHMLNRYYEEREKGLTARKAAITSVRTVGSAVFFAAISTIIGFGSFAASGMPPIKTLGIFAGIGVFFAFILSVLLLPAMLVIRDRGTKGVRKGPRKWIWKKVSGGLVRVVSLAERYKRPILIGVTVTAGASLIFAFGLSTTMTSESMLSKGAKSIAVRNDIQDYFGTRGYNVVIVNGDLTSPKSLQTMLSLETEVMDDSNPKKDLITNHLSLADLIYANCGISINRACIRGTIENLRKSNPELIESLTLENGGVIYFTVNTSTDKKMAEATDIIRSHVKNVRDPRLNMRIDGEPAVGGFPAVFSDIMEMVTPSMVRMTILALILVTIILSLVFRSPIIGAITILPTILAFLWEFGALRVIGWPLNVMTMGVSALVIGIGVDYAVHISYRFKEELKKGHSPKRSVRIAASSVGRAIVAAAVTTIGAFVIISLSIMPLTCQFGTLTALVISFAFISSLVVLPSVLLARKLL